MHVHTHFYKAVYTWQFRNLFQQLGTELGTDL